MKPLLILLAGSLLLSCQSTTPAATGHVETKGTEEPGIHYGMSKQDVIARTSRSDKIISTAGEGVISEGLHGPSQQRARKTFMFMGGKLSVVNYTML